MPPGAGAGGQDGAGSRAELACSRRRSSCCTQAAACPSLPRGTCTLSPSPSLSLNLPSPHTALTLIVPSPPLPPHPPSSRSSPTPSSPLLATFCSAFHISEDVFAGYNHTLRAGNVKFKEYISVGKGRDMGFDSINSFESKVGAGGEVMAWFGVVRCGVVWMSGRSAGGARRLAPGLPLPESAAGCRLGFHLGHISS